MSPTLRRILTAAAALGLVALALVGGLRAFSGGSGGDGSGAGGAGGPPDSPASRTLTVDVVVLAGERLVNRVETTGFLLANEEVELRAEASGRLVSLGFEEGARVQAGQLLAKLNDDELQARLRQLAARRTLLEQREGRQRRLLEEGGVSRESWEETLAELEVLAADLDVLEAEVRRTEVRAPFDGVMGLREVSPGAYLTPDRVLGRLREVNPLRLEFSLPARLSGVIGPGASVTFSVEGQEGVGEGEARIYAIDPGLDEDTRTLQVRARTPNPDGRLRPGAFARVSVVLDERGEALTVPSIAIRPSPEGPRVYLERNGRASLVSVTTGIRTRDRVEITSGLESGDRVILTGFQQLRDGMEVRAEVIPPEEAFEDEGGPGPETGPGAGAEPGPGAAR
ncbi:MAG: efflux RND transporter periplasmic adaptor subunit [Gemmatimonadales bacterium]|nr:MAG: efflux RND transporter periplasmic adaptor subunit [Gemmatimonadales bacterium]